MTTTVTPSTAITYYRRKRIRWLNVKEQLTGYLFILPSVVIISMFGLFPIGYAFYMSLFRWQVVKGPIADPTNYEKALGDWRGVAFFVGGLVLLALAYWLWTSAFKAASKRALVIRLGAAIVLIAAGLTLALGWTDMTADGDLKFLNAIPITLYYSIGTVPAEIGIALVLAYLLFQNIRGKSFFRMLYFLPYVTPAVATAVVFRSIFSPRDSSLANRVLEWIGYETQKWLKEPDPFNEIILKLHLEGFFAGPSMALTSIIFFGIWTYIGYNTVIFLAGLGSIPPELYEAAEIDGAGKWQVFRYVTLPLLSPVTFYLALVAFIGTFKAFNHIYVMKSPEALGTADVASVYIFDTFYRSSQFGYAAAQAIILFLIILGLTFAQNKVFGEKVFYG